MNEAVRPYIDFLSEPWNLAVAAVALAVLIYLWVRLRGGPKVIQAFSDDAGTVYISVQALTDLVRATCGQIEGVSRPRIQLNVNRGVTGLHLRIRLESGARIRDIRDRLKHQLKRTLQTNLGFEQLGDIVIVVDEYKPGPLDSFLPPEEDDGSPDQDDALPPPSPEPVPIKSASAHPRADTDDSIQSGAGQAPPAEPGEEAAEKPPASGNEAAEEEGKRDDPLEVEDEPVAERVDDPGDADEEKARDR